MDRECGGGVEAGHGDAGGINREGAPLTSKMSMEG